MKINKMKMKMKMPASFLETLNGTIIRSQGPIKILGFNFDTNPTVSAHLKIVQKKFKSRIWALRHLKKNGFSQLDLVRVYKAMVRPTAEYCSVVFHPLITKSDSLELERIQMQALKGIFGWNISYEKLLEKAQIERLDVRREARLDKLATKMSESRRFSEWFPLRLYRGNTSIRKTEKYKVYMSTTERYLKSPLNVMRRRLNEQMND